jgi:hypothetical protein
MESYPYGMNTQEKDNEIFTGAYGAEYWEYDSRIGRRWNVDPVFKPWQSRYHAFSNRPIINIDPNGANDSPPDDHYINDDGSIKTVQTDDSFDRFYVETGTFDRRSYKLVAQLEKNDDGLVEFPSSGSGFVRYGQVDKGGKSDTPEETVGEGDHYIYPVTAAAIFGVINSLRGKGIILSLGDMSSSTGTDPWQKGSKHHAGHGHRGTRTGLDIDFRYSNTNGTDIQDENAFKNTQFSLEKNTLIFTTAAKYGFTVNYQGLSGTIPNVTKMVGHNDHGHLGLDFSGLNWKILRRAPTFNNDRIYMKLFKFN